MSSDTDHLAETAQTAAAAGDWASARDAWEALVARETTAEALAGLGDVLWWLGRTDDAVRYQERAYVAFRQRGDAASSIMVTVGLYLIYRVSLGNAAAARGWLARSVRLIAECDLQAVGGLGPPDSGPRFTLSGGISYLTRRHGLAVDNLVGADVVLADGTLVRAGAREDEDLLWALTGGGGNVGVVTELRMRLHPVSVVTGGPMLFPRARTERLVQLYRDWMPRQPADIYAFLALLTVPPDTSFPEELRGRPACALVWCNTGPQPGADKAMAPFRAERPVVDAVGRLPYPALQSAFDAGAASGRYGHLTGLLFEELPNAAVAELGRFGAAQPTPLCQSHLYPLDGAAARPDRGDTVWPWRDAAFAQMFAGSAATVAQLDRARDWSTDFCEALRPYAMPGQYANFATDAGPHVSRACYGSNRRRLAVLKARYDPANVFRGNHNVAPAAA